MTARSHVLAVVLALVGHLVGVIGLPLPPRPPSALAATASAKAPKKCCCACGDGCGVCCCCCGESKPQPTPPDSSQQMHWVASVQLQKCFGVGPAGMTDLPPCLPVVRSTSHIQYLSEIGAIRLMSVNAEAVSSIPAIPPPRAA